MKHTQHDLVVLWLSGSNGWHKAYELEKQMVGTEMIGSEADTRLYELFDKCVTDADHKTTTREVDGATYTIETTKNGANRVYRAFLSQEAPAQKRYFTTLNGIRYEIIKGEMVRV